MRSVERAVRAPLIEPVEIMGFDRLNHRKDLAERGD
ncbi:hypothetical protein QFZ33_001124 [Arthrobacter globiformis]|nr:hypothetical protein [Arthrobacter globiformis]